LATFITIGYGDRAGYEQTDPSERQPMRTTRGCKLPAP
jgi:hypothetical protein